MFKEIKKYIFYLIIFLLFFGAFAKTAKAQEVNPWYNQDFKEWFLKVYDDTNPTEIFGERYTAAQVQWIFYSIVSLPFTNAKDLVNCGFSGDINNCKDVIIELISTNTNQKTFIAKKEPTKGVKDFIFEEREISGITYTKKLLAKLNPITEAKAQEGGYGYQSLGFIQPMWQTIRNASYFFLIIATIFAAFLIMFRVKISPQTVITIQNLLPKIIFALILITFSYAIAGFLMDLMYVAFAVIYRALFGSSYFDFAWTIFNGSSLGIILVFLIYAFLLFISLLAGFLSWVMSNVLNAIVGTFLSPVLFLLILLIMLVIIIIFFFNFFKITFMLIKNIAELLVNIIFSPLSIMAETAMGKSPTSFINKIIAKLAVFVTTGILMFLSLEFLILSILTSLKNNIDNNYLINTINFVASLFGSPNLILSSDFVTPGGIWNPPFFGEGLMGIVLIGVSLAIMSIIPKTADLVKSMIEGKPFAYGSAIGEAVGTATTVTRGGLSFYAGKVEEQRVKVMNQTGVVTTTPKWISFLKTVGTIK